MIFFDLWNRLKQNIEQKEKIAQFHEREVCFVHLGKNIGFEQDGKHDPFERPVVILKKFSGRTFLGIPITSNMQKSGKFYFAFLMNEKPQNAILSQARTLDAKRITRKMGYIAQNDFVELRKRYFELLT